MNLKSFKKFFIKLDAYRQALWREFTMLASRRRAKGTRLKTITSILLIPEFLEFGRDYRPDPGKKGNWDQTIHPCLVQRKINTHNFGTKNMDCDDHAVYWSSMLLKNKLADKVWFVTLRWQKGAHAFCVYQKGNDFFWGDYIYPEKCNGKYGYIEKVNARYSEKSFKHSIMYEVKYNPKTDSIKLRKPEVIMSN